MAIFGQARRGALAERRDIDGMAALLCHSSYVVRAPYWKSGSLIGGYVQAGEVPVSFAQNARRAVWIDGRIEGRGNPAQWLLNASADDRKLSFLADTEGDFHGALINTEPECVQLFTNRYGTRPLYVGRSGKGIAWSSELKAFPGGRDFQLTIDHEAVQEFLQLGVQIADKTWFKDVRMLRPSEIVILSAGRIVSAERYWQWPMYETTRRATEETVERMGQLFMDAVSADCAGAKLPGVSLSGGLDSRAIVAALPPHSGPVHTFTYGRRRSLDRRLARRVARLAGTIHHEFDYDARSWFEGQIEGVWRGDGVSFIHNKGHRLWEQRRRWYTDNLHGAGGDGVFGGAQLFSESGFVRYAHQHYGPDISEEVLDRFHADFQRLNDPQAFYVEHRIRRFTSGSTALALSSGVNQQFPFLCHRLQELLHAIDDDDKQDNRLYASVLLHHFPDFYDRIPWQRTGRVLNAGPARRPSKIYRKLQKRLRRRGLWPRWIFHDFQDVAAWLRMGPARDAIESVLYADQPYYAAYLDPGRAYESWQRHLAGEDHAEQIGRVVSLEWWLRQVHERKER